MVPGAEAHRGIDHDEELITRTAGRQVPGRRDGDPADGDGGQAGLAAPRPVFIRNNERVDGAEPVGGEAGQRDGRGVANVRPAEEDAPPVGGVELLHGEWLVVVKRGVEQILERFGRRVDPKAQVEGRILSQRCL